MGQEPGPWGGRPGCPRERAPPIYPFSFVFLFPWRFFRLSLHGACWKQLAKNRFALVYRLLSFLRAGSSAVWSLSLKQRTIQRELRNLFLFCKSQTKKDTPSYFRGTPGQEVISSRGVWVKGPQFRFILSSPRGGFPALLTGGQTYHLHLNPEHVDRSAEIFNKISENYPYHGWRYYTFPFFASVRLLGRVHGIAFPMRQWVAVCTFEKLGMNESCSSLRSAHDPSNSLYLRFSFNSPSRLFSCFLLTLGEVYRSRSLFPCRPCWTARPC